MLQETHIEENVAPSRYTIPNHTVIARLNHNQYGTMTYARTPNNVSVIDNKITDGNIHKTEIKIEEITIMNIYKPYILHRIRL